MQMGMAAKAIGLAVTALAIMALTVALPAVARAQVPVDASAPKSPLDVLREREDAAETPEALQALIPEYEALAEAGDTGAMLRRAYVAKKLGNEEDLRKWLRRLADLGDPMGQYSLASALRRTSDCSESRELLRKSAEQGFEKSLTALAFFYDEGTCGPRDRAQAAVWYEKAARLGIGVAQNNLAWLYYKGKGVDKDLVTALAWFRIAAQHYENTADRAVVWSPVETRGFVRDIERKLSDSEKAKAYALAADLCGQDKVCSRISSQRRALIMRK